MPRAELAAFFTSLGERPYRATQLMKWLYHAGVDDFDAMTDMSKKLRARLKEVAEIRAPTLHRGHQAGDGVIKWLAEVGPSRAVETVLIPDMGRGRDTGQGCDGGNDGAGGNNSAPPGRATLCISAQVGCGLDCSFCATGKQGFGGNLTRAEIVGQVWQAARRVRHRYPRGITNVVFMGMGEPLLNFKAAMDAADVFMDHLGFGISKRRVTVSTAGIVPRIYDLADRCDVSLAVSLHAPNDALRDELVPINRKYPITELLAACRYYLRRVGDRRAVTFEYTLIDGINDHVADARALAALLRDWRCKVNLIPFNPFPVQRGLPDYRRPSTARVAQFQRTLLNAGLGAMLRTTRGDDIGAACGQLTGAFEDRTRRRERYRVGKPARFGEPAGLGEPRLSEPQRLEVRGIAV